MGRATSWITWTDLAAFEEKSAGCYCVLVRDLLSWKGEAVFCLVWLKISKLTLRPGMEPAMMDCTDAFMFQDRRPSHCTYSSNPPR